jgi:hypothetical protein
MIMRRFLDRLYGRYRHHCLNTHTHIFLKSTFLHLAVRELENPPHNTRLPAKVKKERGDTYDKANI